MNELELKELSKTAALFKAATDKKKGLKADLSVVQDNLDSLEAELYAQLEYAELESIKTTEGTFFKKTRLACSCPPEDKEGFYALLKEKGDGDIVYETINHNVLSSWVKEQIKEGEVVPECLKINTIPQIGFRKS